MSGKDHILLAPVGAGGGEEPPEGGGGGGEGEACERDTLVSEESEDFLDERELFGMCSLGEDEELSAEILKRTEMKPFAGFGSYRQRHGEPSLLGGGSSAEAPAKLETGLFRGASVPSDFKAGEDAQAEAGWTPETPSPVVEVQAAGRQGRRGQRRLRSQRSLSSLISRDEAWERRSQKVLQEEMELMKEEQIAKAVGRSASDCGDRSWPRPSSRARARTRSLTDEDLDELRGCIDLGFGFSNEREDPQLCNTLPALELCYAIARSYNERSSPVSTLERAGGSLTNSPKHSWTISSPGDHPQQVKTRLRHWAQAVACTVRQNC